jgi:hypothetical protein
LLGLPLGFVGLLAGNAAASAKSEGSGTAASSRKSLAALQAWQQTAMAQLELTDSRQNIHDVLMRYARGWDRLDEELLRSCFFPDAHYKFGAFDGTATDFINFGMTIVRPLLKTSHIITNVSIDVVGDKAVSECYFLAHHRRLTPNQDYFLKGRYLDNFEKRNGEWKIAHRIGLTDFSRVFDPADTSFDKDPPDYVGGRKPNDPIYALLAQLHSGG